MLIITQITVLTLFALSPVFLSPAGAKSPILKPGEVVLSADVVSNSLLPRNWRASTTFGSGEFSPDQFLVARKEAGTSKLLVVDLRQEPHGFINDRPVTWYADQNALNSGKSTEEIEKDEIRRLAETVGRKLDITLWLPDEGLPGKPKSKPSIQKTDVKSARTERSLVEALGAQYRRLPIPDYQRPDDATVNQIVSLYKTVDPQTGIYVHCAAGKGRTTTLMVLFDIMRNGSQVSERDIIRRQHTIGGADLLDLSKAGQRTLWAKERKDFLHAFYRYSQSQAPLFKMTWTEWLKTDSGRRIPTAE